ncbi:MAG TPA: LAGLIDADG family homing endonuclease [Patescibacteria group bacterium]|nr:LAGLIDADG family homing endonuclease [Patescibacteria group bacterium]
MKPKNKIKAVWSPIFAYCLGLMTTDGNLSKDGRHLNLTSKDKQLIDIFAKALNIQNKITLKKGGLNSNTCYFLQFGDVQFYKFLNSIGLEQNKSKTLGKVKIPDKYFFDFLRGHFDGDGSFYSYWDPRWRSSFMFYTVFISASKTHTEWLQTKVRKLVSLKGHITKSRSQACYQLKYAKNESIKLLSKIYYEPGLPTLERKVKKVYNALAIHQQNINARVV